MLIDALYVDADLSAHPEVLNFSRRLNIRCTPVSDPAEVYADVNRSPDPVARGKQVLYLTRNRGAFVRECPGTRHYTCCGYRILHVASYCTMDCSYCILQGYFHPPVLRYFVNHEDLVRELEGCFADGGLHRFGTGEFTDSLIWDGWTGLSADLVRRFAGQATSVLELKTKTARIDHLVALPHGGRTVLAWSLNTERVIRTEERGTAPLEHRLRAAAAAVAAGYPVAFHFDPLVIYDGCEADYGRVIDRMFAAVGHGSIVWVSLGAFRFMPDLKSTVARRFPVSSIVYGEFVPGLDGKMRYFKPLRMRLFRALVAAIRAHAPQVCVYLCMEDDEVWRHALGFTPVERGGLSRMLDQAAARHCGVSGRSATGAALAARGFEGK
jgi:spore photoproduct lyase